MYIILFCYSSSKIQHLFCFLIGFKIKSVLKMPHEIYIGTTYNRNHFKTFGFGSFFFVKLFKVNLFKTHSIIEIYVLKMTYNSPFTIFLLDFCLFINSKSWITYKVITIVTQLCENIIGCVGRLFILLVKLANI